VYTHVDISSERNTVLCESCYIILCAINDIFLINLLCSAAHTVLTSLHRPVTVAEYYARRKINKKIAKAKTGGKVLEKLVFLSMCEYACCVMKHKTELSVF